MEGTAHRDIGIQVLGGFGLRVDGRSVPLALGAQRLLGCLALTPGGLPRAIAAELLWPDSPRGRAGANLRSALWRARRYGHQALVECDGARLLLAPSVATDLHVALELAREPRHERHGREPADAERLIAMLSEGLLMDWSDDWLLIERQRWDQIRLHTLEALAQQLMACGTHLVALKAAFAAVAIEPVRESAHRTVVEIFLAEGNTACALKHYQRYRGMVQRELGVTPSRHMTRLVQPLAMI
ncbi:AfsR/SARP family transcriptional regulator [Pseudonocardia sp.]|uniref:AfsR/SARP family transcriptional regulator n=1 Tax=Pseudonocardia sp. TaxID=60912 RepID=UPI003D0E3A1B